MIDAEDDILVRHVVSGGLKHNKPYRVYVTQVNKQGLESPKSEPAYVRVGDVTAPPVPVLEIDGSEYKNGCNAVENFIDVHIRWKTVVCDDLGGYNLYVWNEKLDGFKGNGVYKLENLSTSSRDSILPSGCTSTIVGGIKSGSYVYLGLQSFDLSQNKSDVYVIRVVAEDQEKLQAPPPPTVAPYSTWRLAVTCHLPAYDFIESVVFYRDGVTEIGKVLFIQGSEAKIIDELDVSVGLTHYYTYLYITKDGRKSPMSRPSGSASAQVIDMRYLNKAALDAYMQAWTEEDCKAIAELQKSIKTRVGEIQKLARELETANNKFEGLYKEFRVKAQTIEFLSAQVKKQGDLISAMQTKITQDANKIQLMATKAELNNKSGEIQRTLESKFTVQANSINSSVTEIRRQVSAADTKAQNAQNAINNINRTLTAYQTQIQQNARDITLRATKSEIDAASNNVTKQMVSQLQIKYNQITSLVANKAEKSQIVQLANSLAAVVKAEDVQAMIALQVQRGISTAVIEADRIVLKGQMLLAGNAYLQGRLSANYLSLVDRNGHVFWGSDTGTVKPTTGTKNIIVGSDTRYGQYTDARNLGSWSELIWFDIVPRPPANFNGMSRTKVSVTFYLVAQGPWGSSPATANNFFAELQLCDFENQTTHNAGTSPFTKIDKMGSNQLRQAGNTISYAPSSGGWHDCSPGNRGYSEHYTSCSVTYEGSLPIGRSSRFSLMGRIFSQAETRTNKLGVRSVTVNWSCS